MGCNDTLHGRFGFTMMDPNVMTAMFFINIEFMLLIVVTHLFHLVLKRFGQPIVISAIFAGIMTGDSGLRYAKAQNGALREANYADVLNSFAERTGASFMLLIALSLDMKYMWRARYNPLIIAAASSLIPILVFLFFITCIHYDQKYFIGMLFFVHTSSPIVVRIITELKLLPTDIGQLVIVSALANDLVCIVLVMFSYNIPGMINGKIEKWRLSATLLVIVITLAVLRPSVRWLNRRNQQRRYLRHFHFFLVLCFLTWLVIFAESVGINGSFVCFLIGVVFPREGPAIRTLRDKLRYIVHNLVLPVYFGWTSTRIDMNIIPDDRVKSMIMGLMGNIAGSMVVKVGGTYAAATYLKIPFQESIPLGFILNVKGSVDILSVSMVQSSTIWDMTELTALLLTIIVNTLVAGAAGTFLARKMKKKFKCDVAKGLKKVKMEEELRVLACVHNPIEIPGILTLARLSVNGDSNNSFSILLKHLIGLPKDYDSHTLFYNQRANNDDLDDEESLSHEYKDVPQINSCVDAFTKETGITVRQFTLACFYDTMHNILCQDIYDYKRTLVLIPSHKEQRYDGKMVCRKEERRRFNLKILKEVPCTVGILMDRPLTGGILHGSKETDTNVDCLSPTSNTTGSDLYTVVAIFCGGPDDQEAVEYAGRLALHSLADVTVVRFLSSQSRDVVVSTQERQSWAYSSFSREIAMIVHKDADERDLDEEFMIDFQQRFVETGKVKYVEKYANIGTDIEAEMKSMVGMYSVFIVGRGRQPTAMMAGLGDWQECIEIGPIGDMLSSDAFMNCGSVLIIQSPNNGPTSTDEGCVEGMFQ